MRYAALASDYDGTLAHDGSVSDDTLRALEKFRQSGRKVIMVTGRHLGDLQTVFSRFDLFDSIVVENGGVLYTPSTREKQVLAPPPNQEFIDALRRRGIKPLGVGDCIVDTRHPHETVVLEVIRDLGLELHVIFNKGAVMVLPSGINKRTGLKAALNALGLSEHNVVGVGDAENDHAFLAFCECSVAVANAHPAVKQTADVTTNADHGAGVVELIDSILSKRLSNRHQIPVGRDGQTDVCVPACGSSLLVSGASGSGKSTFVAGLFEVLMEHRYQVCLIDPEGDYGAFPNTVTAGDEKHAPSIDEILQILQKPASHAIANLMGVAVPDRPAFLGKLLPRLQEMRLQNGRPHWIIIDEAHHMLPPGWTPSAAGVPGDLKNLILITVHPERVAAAALQAVDSVFVVGPAPGKVMEAFARSAGVKSPSGAPAELATGQVLAWFLRTGDLRCLGIRFSHADRKRHKRNYAHGELSEESSFYFRGRGEKMHLRAQNLATFVQLAEGLDDDTWLYHLHRGDYSRWFREGIKDEGLAGEAEQAEHETSLNPRESRERIKAAIEQRYTAPA